MQHLREHEAGGVLADDMGLGKTLQTIAHLASEKEARRLDRPSLIVVPTSLVGNWQRELRRRDAKILARAPARKRHAKLGEDRHVGAAEAVDRLLAIADDEKALLAKVPRQLAGRAVGWAWSSGADCSHSYSNV